MVCSKCQKTVFRPMPNHDSFVFCMNCGKEAQMSQPVVVMQYDRKEEARTRIPYDPQSKTLTFEVCSQYINIIVTQLSNKMTWDQITYHLRRATGTRVSSKTVQKYSLQMIAAIKTPHTKQAKSCLNRMQEVAL